MVIVKDWINTLPKLLLLTKLPRITVASCDLSPPLRQHGHREGLDLTQVIIIDKITKDNGGKL
jgi:hypothetical protein